MIESIKQRCAPPLSWRASRSDVLRRNRLLGDKALDGLFHYLGVEQAAIRTNPAARTTDLLKKVFS